MKEIVLDTETTGLSVKDGHRIVEIGCIELDNQILTSNRFHCYLNPQRKVSEEAFKVHGYSDEFLSDKKKFSEIADDFIKFIDDKRIGETFMETHADGSEIYVGLDNQFSGFKKLLNKNYDFIHAAMGTYQVTEAGPARLELNGQYVTADKLEDTSEWGVANPEWDSYWRLKGHPEGVASTLRA